MSKEEAAPEYPALVTALRGPGRPPELADAGLRIWLMFQVELAKARRRKLSIREIWAKLFPKDAHGKRPKLKLLLASDASRVVPVRSREFHADRVRDLYHETDAVLRQRPDYGWFQKNAARLLKARDWWVAQQQDLWVQKSEVQKLMADLE